MKKLATLLLTLAMLCTLIALPAAADETVNLIWWTGTCGDSMADEARILEIANAYSAEKIGVTVDLQRKSDDQLLLDLETGEYYDMIFTCSWFNNFDSRARDGYYYDITNIVETAAPALYKAIDPYWVAGAINDRVYGVPLLKDIGIQVFFRINSDYYEGEKGMTIPDTMEFADLEEYLALWKADHPDEYPLHMTKSGLSGMWQVDQRVVSSYLVIPYGAEDATTIIPVWEDETWMSMLRLLHKWYELGYINPDAATNESLPMSLGTPIRSGTAWTGYKGWSNPETYGFTAKLCEYIGPFMSRPSMQGSLTAINAAASEKNAIAALKYIELMYTDPYFVNLLSYGIEGEHFNYAENGTIILTPAASERYGTSGYIFYTCPYISASVVSASENLLGEADQWEQVYAAYKNAKMSAIGGFSFDGESTEDLRTNLYAIYSTHYAELVTGTVDPDEVYAQLSEEMYAAGLQTVLDEAQRQLNEYLSAQ